MMKRKIAAILAAAALMASGPALAQATAPAAPSPAAENALQGSAQFEGNETVAYVLAAVVAGGLIFGLVKLLDDDEGGTPVSP